MMQKYKEPLQIVSTKLTEAQIEKLAKLQELTGRPRAELLRDAVDYYLQIRKTDLEA